MPHKVCETSTALLYLIKGKFTITSNVKYCDIIDESAKLYENIIFPPRIYNDSIRFNSPVKLLTKLSIVVDDVICPGYPDGNMDESCTLFSSHSLTRSAIHFIYCHNLRMHNKITDHLNISWSEATAFVAAKSVWGALRGLETFSQLIYFTDDQKVCSMFRFALACLVLFSFAFFSIKLLFYFSHNLKVGYQQLNCNQRSSALQVSRPFTRHSASLHTCSSAQEADRRYGIQQA